MTAGVVIAGAGLAAQRCAQTLRSEGFEGPIRVVGDEPHAPYDRPPLSKEALAGGAAAGALALRPADWYAEHRVELLLGTPALRLDPARHTLELADGARLRYDRLLIATGAAPRQLPGTERFGNVHTLRTLADAVALRAALVPGSRLAVIGAGFIGQEVAATARKLGIEVTIVEAAPTPLHGILGPQLGAWFADLHRAEGTDVICGAQLTELAGAERVEALVLDDGRRIPCDTVVVGIGVAPATEWLAGSGLDPSGVQTDPSGRTPIPGVYAAGDAARPFDSNLGVHVRTEHWEAAARQGADAARAMLGLPSRPALAPSFWSDQYGIRIQLVGHAAGADSVELDGEPDDRDFSAIFLRGGRPAAVLLVGRPRALPFARRLVASDSPATPNQSRSAA